VLEVDHVAVAFDGNRVVDDVALTVEPGELVGIIGPNGAGKSTLLDAISGFVRPVAGRIRLDGVDITDLLPYQRVRLGLGRSFQDARLFPTMTVRETLAGGFHPLLRGGIVAEGLRLPDIRRQEHAVNAAVADLLDLVDLRDYLDYRVSELSFGTTRALELAWLAARRPKLLLLDEPAAGLQQSEVRVLGQLIERIRGPAAVVVVDHDVPFVTGLADRLVAMDLGRVIADGSCDGVLTDPTVVTAYLGSGQYAGAAR
jgi:ABC-type branched-subunit amino acid transport system ATPase component